MNQQEQQRGKWNPYPVLDLRDSGNLDWPEARYSTILEYASDDETKISHALAGAGEISRLLIEGSAHWCVEVRGLRTFHSQMYTEKAGTPEKAVQHIPVARDYFGSEKVVHLPGILAVEHCQIVYSDGCGLHPDLWASTHPILIPKGAWLARGQFYNQSIDPTSIIEFKKFRPEEERALKQQRLGRPDPLEMRLEYNHVEGMPEWVVKLRSETFAMIQNQSTQGARTLGSALTMAAFATAFADSKRWRDHIDEHGNPSDPRTAAVMHKLEELDPDMPPVDHDEFDPLRAAFLLCRELENCFDEEDES